MSDKGKYWFGKAMTVSLGFSALTATNNEEYSFWVAPFPIKVVKCSVIFDDAVTGAATNNFGVRFKNKGAAGSGTSVMVTKTFDNAINASQFDEVDLGAVSYAEFNEGDTITFEKFENNSGANMPGVTAVIQYIRVR